ncbi:hypothetical protein LTR12_002263, partial [Friedmanniomyces endolithicus]
RLGGRNRKSNPHLLLLIPLLHIRTQLTPQRPDTSLHAFVAEVAGQGVRVGEEVVLDELGDFAAAAAFGEVVLVEGFADEAVDVVDLVVGYGLVEDFGADGAGGACEEDLHVGLCSMEGGLGWGEGE